MTNKEYLINYLQRLADDSLIAGQRMAEWCSRGPILEEDLAMVNISLDYFGQSEIMLEYVSDLLANGKTADDLAFGRSEREYYNHLIVELPNGDFAVSMMKLLFFSAYQMHNFSLLSTSADEKLAGIASRSYKESRYHFRHASDWVVRLSLGTDESRSKIEQAIQEIFPFTGNLFETDVVSDILEKAGVAADGNNLRILWSESISGVFERAQLEVPQNIFLYSGGIDGYHTEHLGHLLGEMQYLHHAHPGAKW
jgi:ring-1,2-phenylacetyl-CoA epoxidase subunit PaaC